MKDKIKLSIFWVFSFIVIIFMMTFTSHAEEIEFDNSLPFQYQLTATYNAQWNETLYSYFVAANLPIDDPDYILIYRDWASYGFDGNYYNVYYYFYLLPIASFGSVNNYNSFDISSNTISYTLDSDKPSYNVTLIVAYYRSGNIDTIYTGRVYNSTTNLGNNFSPTLFGHAPQSTTINNGYNFTSTSMCPVYFTRRFLNVDDYKILTMGLGEDEIGLGHATPPGDFSNPTINSGSNHTLPREVPDSPIYNNYTWLIYNPPSIDTTNVESLLESLIDVINYLAAWLSNNVSGEFANLISNFSLFFDYIAETIQYYGGLIISNIQNGIETFYNNMVSLVEPIFAKIDYIITPLEVDVIWDNISTTSLVTNISTIQNSLSSFQGAFTGVNEPSSYTIPIHLENLPSSWFGNQTTQYLDLGIINGTVKDGLRLFVWAMVTYGLVVTIFDSIANYINGGGDES